MKDHDEIAAKAASSLCAAGYINREHEAEVAERIQSAIEKAYRQGRTDIEREIYGLKDRAAHASGCQHEMTPACRCRKCGKTMAEIEAAHASGTIPTAGLPSQQKFGTGAAHASELVCDGYRGDGGLCVNCEKPLSSHKHAST